MKRVICTLLALLLVAGLCAPKNVQASETGVKVKYKGVTTTYAQKKTYIFINGKNKSLSKVPAFIKSGSFVGPAYEIFKTSALKINYTATSKTITFTYNNKKLKMTDGSLDVVLNGKTEKKALLAAPMRAAKYTASGKSRWIVPIKSVCSRLGLEYQLKNGVLYVSAPQPQTTAATVKTTATVKASAATTSTTAATGTTAAATKQIVLVMDAGHGGVDSGAVGNGYKEKNMTLAILLGAKKYFDSDSRFKVYYTRTADTYPSLDDRCKLANNRNADIFISVHINSASSSASGTETLYNNARNSTTKKNGITSKSLALAMQKAAIKTTGFYNRGLVNRTGLRVLNKTTMPACLIEYGFISNATEAKKMHANTSRYGKELYQAIAAYLKSEGKIK